MAQAKASSGEVDLWKAPEPGRNGARELVDGFDPQVYPGNGPYFTTDQNLAEAYQRHYQAGLEEIHMPRETFDDLLGRGIILEDPLYPAGVSYHVPPSGLSEFNRAMQQGGPNVFHAQSCAHVPHG